MQYCVLKLIEMIDVKSSSYVNIFRCGFANTIKNMCNANLHGTRVRTKICKILTFMKCAILSVDINHSK